MRGSYCCLNCDFQTRSKVMALCHVHSELHVVGYYDPPPTTTVEVAQPATEGR